MFNIRVDAIYVTSDKMKCLHGEKEGHLIRVCPHIGEAERRSASNKQVDAQNSENEETGGWGCRYDREKDREKGKTGKQTQVNVTEEQIERER